MIVTSDRLINGTIHEDVCVDEGATLAVNGMIYGDISVKHGKLVLRGMLEGNLSVSSGASAVLLGTARCDSVEALGIVEVEGILDFRTTLSDGIVLKDGCIVNGRRY